MRCGFPVRGRIRVCRPLFLFCLLFLFSMSLLIAVLPHGSDPLPYEDRETVTIEGKLMRKELRRDYEDRVVPVWYLKGDGQQKFMIQCYPAAEELPAAEPAVGQICRVRGAVRLFSPATNPGEFDAAEYYQILGISFRLTNAVIVARGGEADRLREGLYRLRIRCLKSLDDCLDAEDAGILHAMLLGDKSSLDAEVKALYQRSGIIHILAISGLHISLIGMGLFRLLTRTGLPRYIAAVISVAVMLCYGEMCGQTASAVRAIVMFILHLGAIILGRSYDILTALALAAVLIVIEQPLYLIYSGFQLSFLAVLAIGVLLPAWGLQAGGGRRRRPEDPPWKPVLSALTSGVFSSLSVALVTLPVYMVTYHTFPVWSVFLNVLILPVMSVLVGAGLMCMLSGLLLIPAGICFGRICHLLLFLFKQCCLQENALPGATWVTGHAEGWQIIAYYLLLAGFLIFRYRIAQEEEKRAPREQRRRGIWLRRGISVLYLGFAIGILSFRLSPPCKITVLDVGQGDGIVLSGGGYHFLIDGGSSSRSKLGTYVLDPYLAYEGISHLDAAILSHEDEDHMNGLLELLEDDEDALVIDRLVLPRVAEMSRGENYGKLLTAAGEHGIPVSTIARGEELTKGALSIRCLGPPSGMATTEANEYSTILYLRFGDFTALFTGDVEGMGETALLETLERDPALARDLTLLKVAHHGSRYTTGDAFLDRVSPEIAVISCGRDNRYGHPHAELMERLRDRGIPSCVTAERGAVTIEVSRDGRNVRVHGFLH